MTHEAKPDAVELTTSVPGSKTTATVGSTKPFALLCEKEHPIRYAKSSIVESVALGVLLQIGLFVSATKSQVNSRGVVSVRVTSEQKAYTKYLCGR